MKVQMVSAAQAHKKSCFRRQVAYLRMIVFHR